MRSIVNLVGKLVNEYGLDVMVQVSDHLSGKEPDPELINEINSIQDDIAKQAPDYRTLIPDEGFVITPEQAARLWKWKGK